ncbi:MAG: hypothetical protein HND59_13885 [Pseudomonadota bacterium]|nr:MAG: hypothetical protein HND59_13885 [Pseudomonadota bacterium]
MTKRYDIDDDERELFRSKLRDARPLRHNKVMLRPPSTDRGAAPDTAR